MAKAKQFLQGIGAAQFQIRPAHTQPHLGHYFEQLPSRQDHCRPAQCSPPVGTASESPRRSFSQLGRAIQKLCALEIGSRPVFAWGVQASVIFRNGSPHSFVLLFSVSGG
jgi:hypothetical protein